MEQIINDFANFFGKEENRYIAIIVAIVAIVIAYKVASIMIKLAAIIVVVGLALFFAYPYVEHSSDTINEGMKKTEQGISSMKEFTSEEKERMKKHVVKPAERAHELYDSAIDVFDNAVSKLKGD